jgi:hypothetical protein
MFSSDPPDPSVDHYFQPRRKKQYRGTWWNAEAEAVQSSDGEQKSKADFARNLDSGIWMGSDNTDESLGSDDLPPESSQAVPGPLHSLSRTTKPVPKISTARTSSEEMARLIVQKCLDNENEIVDLR